MCTTLGDDEFEGNNCKIASVTNAPRVWCFANTAYDGEFISGVNFGSVENYSGWQVACADYTSIYNPLVAGSSEPITIANGNPWALDKVIVWVDWNQDLGFGTGDEQYILNDTIGSGQLFTGDISIPETVICNEYRMRVRINYDVLPEPCGSHAWGEIEDYTITIIDQSTHDLGVQSVLSPVSGTNLGEEQVTVRVKNYGSSTESYIPVSYSVNGGSEVWEMIDGPLASGESIDYTFAETVDLSNPGETYSIAICTGPENNELEGNNCKNPDITNELPAYCMPYAKVSLDYIDYVVIGDISNSSDWQDTVADYTSMTTIIEDGATENIYVGVQSYSSTNKVWIWIDWNKDFSFDSSSELFATDNFFNGTITVPVDQPPGDYRLRVRLLRGGDPIPCENSYFGETEDYTITVVPQPDYDVGVTYIQYPTSGIYLGDENVKTRVKNYGFVPQSDIPVFYTVDGGEQVTGIIEGPVLSRESVDYTFPETVNLGTVGHTYQFNICTNLSGDEVPANDCNSISVTNYFQSYCYASTNTENEYIANVLIGEINNSSGWQGDVADYTSMFATISVGTSKEITVTNGNPYVLDQVSAWVDWNQDFEFECCNPPDERFDLTNVGGTGEIFTGQIVVPDSTFNGDYRMRIRMTYSSAPCPCWESSYGEVEDYTIRVTAGEQPELTWLSATPLTGSLAPNESTIVKVLFNSDGFGNGTYIGSVNFAISESPGSSTLVPVTLNVGCILPAPLNFEGHENVPNIAYLSWEEPETSKELLGYNLYRDGEKINPEILTGLFYEDSLENPSQYLYFVTAVYPECEAASNTISLLITKFPENENQDISFFPNPVKHILNLSAPNIINRVMILNDIGRTIYSNEFDHCFIQINTSTFDNGIYILKVVTSDGIATQKLVVQ